MIINKGSQSKALFIRLLFVGVSNQEAPPARGMLLIQALRWWGKQPLGHKTCQTHCTPCSTARVSSRATQAHQPQWQHRWQRRAMLPLPHQAQWPMSPPTLCFYYPYLTEQQGVTRLHMHMLSHLPPQNSWYVHEQFVWIHNIRH